MEVAEQLYSRGKSLPCSFRRGPDGPLWTLCRKGNLLPLLEIEPRFLSLQYRLWYPGSVLQIIYINVQEEERQKKK
jgi:hypothetical protein